MNTKGKSLIFVLLLSLSALFVISVPDQAFAAVDMFIKIEGIDGESVDKDHKGEIDVLAWSWGMSQSGSSISGGGGAGKVSVQDMSLTKYLDSSSPKLMEKIAQGEHIPKISLTVQNAGSTIQEYLIITMTDVMVTSYSVGGSGGEDRLTENITLNFAKIEFKYIPFDESGRQQEPVTVSIRNENTA